MKLLNWLKEKQHIIIAVILYCITCVTLYMIECWIYEGAINTNFMYFSILPIFVIIGLSNKDHNKPIEKANKTVWSKIGTICCNTLLILLSLLLINILYKNIYELVAYLYLELTFIVTIIYLSKKLKRLKQFHALSVSIIYGAFLITILLYVIILNPFTVKEASVNVQNSGFTNVSYKNNLKTLSLILDTEIIDSSKYEGNLGYYLFQGEQDEKDYFIIVSVTNGTIVFFEEVTQNNRFQYLLN